MRIKLRARPQYNGQLYKINFIDGVSQEHVSEILFKKFEIVVGLEPEWIPDVCENCNKLQLEIKELKELLSKKKK